MRKLLFVILLASVASASWANICAFDDTPSATLLFPYVVFDYSVGPSMFTNPPYSQINTIVTITNTSPDAQVAHVELWTDFGVGILGFDIILTGYDVVEFSMRDILIYGQLPVTIQQAHTETEGIVSRGPVSEASVLNGAWLSGTGVVPEPTSGLGTRCDPTNPAYPGLFVTPMPPAVLSAIQQALISSQTAARSYTNDCDGFDGDAGLSTWFTSRESDDPTWMYLTVDVTQACSFMFPDTPLYWVPYDTPVQGQARYDNVLIGHVTYTIPPFILASAQAVHVEADRDLAQVATMGPAGYPISFYHRYSTMSDPGLNDYREPLPTAWAMPYLEIPGQIDTSLVVWKGSSFVTFPMDLLFTPTTQDPSAFVASNCHPYTYYAWDQDENVVTLTTGIEPNLLPLSTQEVPVDEFTIVDSRGWIELVFPASNYVVGAGQPSDVYQTYAGTFTYFGASVSYLRGNPIANQSCFDSQRLPSLAVDFDYVDQSGYVSSGN